MVGAEAFMSDPCASEAWTADEGRILAGPLEAPEKNRYPLRRLYFSAEHCRLESLLRTDRLLVAADTHDSNHIVGWLLDPSGLGHVKGRFEGLGIEDKLAAFALGP